MASKMNPILGQPDPRDHKVTRDGMVPLTRMEGKKPRKKLDGSQKEAVDQLIEYEWPGE